jgi:hypothetical protein
VIAAQASANELKAFIAVAVCHWPPSRLLPHASVCAIGRSHAQGRGPSWERWRSFRDWRLDPGTSPARALRRVTGVGGGLAARNRYHADDDPMTVYQDRLNLPDGRPLGPHPTPDISGANLPSLALECAEPTERGANDD